jgi:Glyoxalase/Bleomycin resistance protein/Dioxygenase superfamily
MLDDQRPGTVYWIDHYVVGSDDLDRWADFEAKVIGAQPQPPVGREGRRFIVFQDITPCCHHGAMLSPEPLPPSAGLGKGLPRHGLFIRQEDIDQHLKRLDQLGVPHLDPARTSAEGDEGISIAWEDVDGNQFEFWAPDRLPDGAMTGCTSVGVGRISHGVYECTDLQRAADHFAKYCALEPLASADIPSDTLVLPLVGGARIVYKKVDQIGQRTGGWGKLNAAHAALVVRDEDFWPNYERMWADVPEWPYDRDSRGFVGAGPELPARTARHGSPGGVQWFEIRGRGDDWYDWDTNCFHFMGGDPRGGSFAEYEPHTMDWHLPEYLKANGLAG